MTATVHPLFCPACGDRDFYTAFPLPRGEFRWVVDGSGTVSVLQGSDELAVLTAVADEVYCTGCHTLVTGTAVARASHAH